MKTLLFLLEEPSAKEMLRALLTERFIVPPDWDVQYRVFEGKQDMNASLTRILKGWLRPDTFFFIIQDQDARNCVNVKNDLLSLCRQANKQKYVVRIACRELESFYIGDLAAVEKGLELRGLAMKQKRRKFRDPDGLQSPSLELRQLSKRRYQKISGSRAIAPFLNPEANGSRSFLLLCRTIHDIFDGKL